MECIVKERINIKFIDLILRSFIMQLSSCFIKECGTLW